MKFMNEFFHQSLFNQSKDDELSMLINDLRQSYSTKQIPIPGHEWDDAIMREINRIKLNQQIENPSEGSLFLQFSFASILIALILYSSSYKDTQMIAMMDHRDSIEILAQLDPLDIYEVSHD